MKKQNKKHQNAKGQLISKWFFGSVNFLQKTNENKSTWGIIVVKSNSFVHFFEEIDDPKNHFEINWPLGSHFFYIEYGMETINEIACQTNKLI